MTAVDEHVTTGPWHDRSLSPRDRGTALRRAMTLTEKIAQLGSSWPGQQADGEVAPMQDSFGSAEPFAVAIADGLGQLTRPYGTFPQVPAEAAARLATLQTEVVGANRFGVPALVHEECLTGFTAWQATVYPTPLAWAATWDPDLVAEMASAIGDDLARAGVHQGLAPVLDVVRDYRWGRVEETMGEDPYLVSEIASAYVTGLQSSGVIATLKHFAGYSASRGARNHAPVAIGPREMADVVLVPFEKAVVQGGARSVMNSYADVDGVPPASDPDLLTGLLRDTWGFDGTVVSDYWSVPFLESMHRVASDLQHAGALALTAGIDVELPHTAGFGSRLEELVRSGQVDEAVVDRAVDRVLTQKAELGLLDADWRPAAPDMLDLDTVRNQDLAGQVAERSVVLLDDKALLPVAAGATGVRRIAVVGPGADDPNCLFGCYSFPNHVVGKNPGTANGVHAPTLVEALREEFPDALVEHARGCDVDSGDVAGLDRAVAVAAAADVTVLVVGDRSGMFGAGTSGEGCDALSLDLPGVQGELADRVLTAARQVVLVVLSGRPYAVGPLVERAGASLQVFFPGQRGAHAVAGVLSGRLEPSGRLPVQVPGASAGMPATYLGPPLAQPSEGVSNLDPTPAFPFGHGLSWTTFRVDSLEAEATSVPTDGVLRLRAQVTNTGDRAGTMVPQLYLSDPVASVARPVRQLVGFTRVGLEPGESEELLLELSCDLTSYTGRDLRRVVEPGVLVLTLAQSASDEGAQVTVDLVGARREVDHTRVLSGVVTTVGPVLDRANPAAAGSAGRA